MAGIGDRISQWVEDRQAKWKDRLAGWMVSWASQSIISWIESEEPELVDEVKKALDKLEANPELPAELKPILDRARGGGHWVQAVLIGIGVAMLIAQTIQSSFRPQWELAEMVERRMAQGARFDPLTLTRIWLRDRTKYFSLWQDLKDQGWSDERITIWRELAKIIPPLADMVRFADFSAFDPDVIAKWRDYYDAPYWLLDPFELIGITNEPPRDWANKYWFSHFTQPGRWELGEMYRRGLLGRPLVGQFEIGGKTEEGEAEETIKLAYQTMAYSQFWQDRLLELVREVPTRVDVRRWWDMRTIDEARLREIYQAQGYFGKDLEDYVRWTKVYTDFPVMMARFRNGWITEDDVRSWLRGLDIPEERIQSFIEEKTKPEKEARVEKERDLTKTDIVNGVKKDIITFGEGVELLRDLGYDADEAEYILTVALTTAGGSPETFAEFKALTQKWRLAVGQTSKPVSEELKAAAQEVVRLTEEVKRLEGVVEAKEWEIVDITAVAPEVTEQLTHARLQVEAAQLELIRIRDRYNTLLAQMRHPV